MSGWTFDERFKAWAEREAMPLVKPNNMLAVATSKDMEAAFLGGISARDAEVEKLRAERDELLTALIDLLHEAFRANDEGDEIVRWSAIHAASAAVKQALTGENNE